VLHVSVERGLCRASGFCVQVAPEVFRIVPSGEWAEVAMQPSRVSDAGEMDAAVMEAEASCPMGAILVDENGPEHASDEQR
jgi:ferredoxin